MRFGWRCSRRASPRATARSMMRDTCDPPSPCFRAAACIRHQLQIVDHGPLQSNRLAAMRLRPGHINLVHTVLRAVRPRHRRAQQRTPLHQVPMTPRPPLLVVPLAHPSALRAGHQLPLPDRQLGRHHATTQALGLLPLRDRNHFPMAPFSNSSIPFSNPDILFLRFS